MAGMIFVGRGQCDHTDQLAVGPDGRVRLALDPERCETLLIGGRFGGSGPALRPRAAGRALPKIVGTSRWNGPARFGWESRHTGDGEGKQTVGSALEHAGNVDPGQAMQRVGDERRGRLRRVFRAERPERGDDRDPLGAHFAPPPGVSRDGQPIASDEPKGQAGGEQLDRDAQRSRRDTEAIERIGADDEVCDHRVDLESELTCRGLTGSCILDHAPRRRRDRLN